MFSTQCNNISTIVDFVVLTAKKLNDQGKQTTADGLLKEALIVVEKHPLLLSPFLLTTIDIYFRAAQYQKAQEYCSKFLESCDFSDDESSDGYISRDFVLGHTYLWSGKNKEAYECLKKDLSNIFGRGSRLREQSSYACLGEVCRRLGRFKEAVECFEKCLAISLDLGQQSSVKEQYRNLATCYNSLGQYNLSISCSEKVLSLCKEMGDWSGAGYDHENLGNTSYCLGKFEKAIEYYKKALARYLEEEDRLTEGNTYASLGGVYLDMGHYQNAKEYCEKALDIGIERNHQLLKLISYEKLGNVYIHFGKLEKAIEFFEKNLAISLQLGDQSEVGSSYGSLAGAYERLGKYDKAIDYYSKNLSICLETGERSAECFCYSGLGTVYDTLGKYDEAINFLEKSLRICLETGKPTNKCYAELGNVYSNKGQLEKASEFIQKSLTISIEIGDRSAEATGYGQLGDVAWSAGEYEKAIRYCKKALSICLEIGYRAGEGTNHGMLGIVYSGLREFEKAINHCNKSLAIRLETGNRLGEGVNYGSLAGVYRCLGQYKKAVVYDTKSLHVFVSIGHRSGVANKYGSLGGDYLRLCQPHKSIEFNKKGLAIALDIGEHVDYFYGNLGCAYRMAGECETSIFLLKKAIKESDKILLECVTDKIKTWLSRECYLWHISLTLSYFCVGNAHNAFLVLDLGKAKALQILIEQRRTSRACKAAEDSYRNPTWQQIEDGEGEERLKDIARDLHLKDNNATVLIYNLEFSNLRIWVLNGDGELSYRMWVPNDEVVSAEDWLYQAMDSLLSNVFLHLSRDCSFFGLSLPERLATKLEGNTLLNCLPSVYEPFDTKGKKVSDNSNEAKLLAQTELSLSDKLGSVLSTCSPGVAEVTGLSSCTLPNDVTLGATEGVPGVPDETMEESATNVIDSKPNDIADSACALYSSRLYCALIQPVADLIKGTKLIIVPDKVLFFTPFCFLRDEHGRYLSENYCIQVAPSLHTLALSKKVPRSENLGPALFVGNPTVGKVLLSRQPFEVPPLPAATEEARSLASRFSARPLVEHKATKDRVLQCIDGASVIHIAAHGLEVHGEILLAPNEQVNQGETLPTERSYLLTQNDVINRQLSAKLVVLCCCYTGRGEPTSEGVLGIARSFLGAGARSVLVALWALPDVTTKVFMEHLYDEICRGTSICEALQKTMNTFQQSANNEYRSFRTWAPFTIIGEDVRFTKEDIEEIRLSSQRAVN